jgi:hypothetical protein
MGLVPVVGEDMNSLLHWLYSQGLTNTADVFDQSLDQALPGATTIDQGLALAQATSRRHRR